MIMKKFNKLITISTNNDITIGKLIVQKVGTEGVITVEEGNGIETYMDVVEGGGNSIEDISHHTLSLIQIKWKYHLKSGICFII